MRYFLICIISSEVVLPLLVWRAYNVACLGGTMAVHTVGEKQVVGDGLGCLSYSSNKQKSVFAMYI